MNKRLYNTGIAVHMILIIMSVLFYKERSIFLDNAFFLFEMIKDESFCIQRYRFVAALPQILPVIAIKLSLPLKAVLIAFSSSYAIYHFVCYWLCGSVLKNHKLALAQLLSYLIITTHTFFWGLSELLTGFSLLFPFLALLLLPVSGSTLKKSGHWLLLVIMLAAIVFSHPLIALPFSFVWLFMLISKHEVENKVPFFIVGGLFFVLAAVKGVFFTDDYESGSISQLTYLVEYFPKYWETYSNIRLYENVKLFYYWLPLLWVFILIIYAARRNWYKFTIIFLGVIAFTQIVNISYPGAHTPDFYRENMYIPLCVFISLPLLYDVAPIMSRKFFGLLLLVVLATGIIRIYNNRESYRQRLDWFRGYIAQHENKKIIGSALKLPQETLIMSWATSYEFWLLSTVETNNSASIILEDDVDAYGWAWEEYRGFVTHWGVYKYKDLNPRYFKFTDTQTHYSVIKE